MGFGPRRFLVSGGFWFLVSGDFWFLVVFGFWRLLVSGGFWFLVSGGFLAVIGFWVGLQHWGCKMGQVCWRVRECVQLSLCTHLLIDQQFLVDCWFGLFAKVCCRCFLAMSPSVDSGVHVLFDSISVVPVFAPPHLLHHILCAFFAVWKPRTPSWSPDQGPTRSVFSVGNGILFHSFICSSVSCAVNHREYISRFPTQKCEAISEGKHPNVDKKSQKNASDKRGK